MAPRILNRECHFDFSAHVLLLRDLFKAALDEPRHRTSKQQ
nr:MAG TPA: hypothetical protein [Bacteriophage sp.]